MTVTACDNAKANRKVAYLGTLKKKEYFMSGDGVKPAAWHLVGITGSQLEDQQLRQ